MNRLTDLYDKYHPTGADLRVLSRTGWLPVSAGLPDPTERVLCCTITKNGIRNHVIGYHDGERWCCGMNSNVTHWTLLPDLPE